MQWHLGTVGFGYKDWQKVFYPELAGRKYPSKDYLKHYAQVFNSVEIDTSFYGCPRLEQILNWADMVPDEFKFCFKTPKLITHDNLLHNSYQQMHEFISTISQAGDKLGPTLIQLPPNFDTQEFNVLKDFVTKLPSDKIQFAIEFRHPSWFKEQATIYTRLLFKKNNICWVANDHHSVPKRIEATANFLYMRFIGRHNAYPVKDHERIDVSERLKWWIEMLEKQPEFKSCYGFFNNDYSGHSPGTCNKFKSLLGLDTLDPLQVKPAQAEDAMQMSLF